MPQGLSFQNMCNQTVWISIAIFDDSCGDANYRFRKQGWWGINSGQTLLIWNVDLRTVNRYAYFEGEFAADATVWGFDTVSTEVTDAGFNQCYNDQTNCNRSVSFKTLDFGGLLGLLVQLGPEGGQTNLVPTYPPPPHSDGGWFGGSS